MYRFRNFIFTKFKKSDLKEFIASIKDNKDIRFFIGQQEICPTTQKEHIQGYMELFNAKTMKAIKKKILGEAHIEKRRGTQIQAIEYCSKMESRKPETLPLSIGEKSKQGKRTDIADIRDMVKQGKPISEILSGDNLNFQQIRCAQILQPIFAPKRSIKPIVIWIYGSTGIGKTKWVYDRFNIDEIFKSHNSKWFDGYEQQKVLLIDDYRRDYIKFHLLLALLDRYPFTREIKGGTTQINSKYIIFTSPSSPFKMWNNRTGEDIAQLERRIDYILNYDLISKIQLLGN